jgi:HD-like signal output (HDOD) protein
MPQPIGRKDSIQTVILTSWRLDSVLYEVAQNFEVFSNIQKGNKKIKKHIAVDVLFKAYRMVPL